MRERVGPTSMLAGAPLTQRSQETAEHEQKEAPHACLVVGRFATRGE